MALVQVDEDVCDGEVIKRMIIERFFVEGLGHMSYLVGLEETGEGVVVDPKRDVGDYLAAAREKHLHITHVLETHVHEDFVSGSRELNAFTGAEIVASAGAGLQFSYTAVEEGEEINVGSLRFRVLQTPGHTPEHVSYLLADTARSEMPMVAFTGGALLVGGVGRADLIDLDLAAKLTPQLYHSLYDKLLRLDDYVEVLPTHGPGSLSGLGIRGPLTSTIGYERRFNEALRQPSAQAFARFVSQTRLPTPVYQSRARSMNQRGPRLIGSLPPPVRMRPERVQERIEQGYIILDTREPAAFGGAHIAGAYNVTLSDHVFAQWVGSVVPSDKPMILVLERGEDYEKAVTQLVRIGHENALAYLEGGMTEWARAGLPFEHLPQLSVQELQALLEQGRAVTVVDVRRDPEWQAGHIPGAVHIPGDEIAERAVELRKSEPIAMVCGSGYRSSTSSSLLLRQGFHNLHNVIGGMRAWQSAGYQTEKPAKKHRAA